MNILRRFVGWMQSDPGPHIALLSLFPPLVLELVRDDDGSVWGGWRGQDRGQWVRLE